MEEHSQIEIIAQSLKDPKSKEIIRRFIVKNSPPKISAVFCKILDNPEGFTKELLVEYAEVIKEHYTDKALDQFNTGEISKEELEAKLKDLEFCYCETIEQEKEFCS
jgi:hypothetical protein